MDSRHIAIAVIATLLLGVVAAVVLSGKKDNADAGADPGPINGGEAGQIIEVSRQDGKPVKIPVGSNPDVEIRYTVRALTRDGIDAEATCLDCKKIMQQRWDSRPAPKSQFLWFKCAGCGGVTWMLAGNLLREGSSARENPEHRSRIFKMSQLPFDPPPFDDPQGPR